MKRSRNVIWNELLSVCVVYSLRGAFRCKVSSFASSARLTCNNNKIVNQTTIFPSSSSSSSSSSFFYISASCLVVNDWIGIVLNHRKMKIFNAQNYMITLITNISEVCTFPNRFFFSFFFLHFCSFIRSFALSPIFFSPLRAVSEYRTMHGECELRMYMHSHGAL